MLSLITQIARTTNSYELMKFDLDSVVNRSVRIRNQFRMRLSIPFSECFAKFFHVS